MKAETPKDYAVQLSARVSINPAAITLDWASDPAASGYSVYRMTPTGTWGLQATLGITNSYSVTNVVQGNTYEFCVARATPTITGLGYIQAGSNIPLVESRGKVLLLVENSVSASLSAELVQLERDLIGDGWTVLRHDISAATPPASVKAVVLSEYQADPLNVRCVFILGHIAVPYSGNDAPDAHINHQGAWPADVYYADVDGVWTDAQVNVSVAATSRNWNTPGDGKFDQSELPSDVELEVGRVDLANLPAFHQTETQLLRNYLNKDHNFRHKLFIVAEKGLIDDNFGVSAGDEFAVNGWRNFPTFFRETNILIGKWFSTLASQSCLWAFGCGPGTFTSAGGIGDTSSFAGSDPKVVFTMLVGSYFGDWDCADNFLRAPLATPTYTLACVWAGRPNWQFHHMALGQTLGYAAKLNQNNRYTYDPNCCRRGIHIALMGDPTLRMHVVAPVSAVSATLNRTGGADLVWNASPDTGILGYNVYRATTASGPFTRINSDLISGTSYTDPSSPTPCVYMVRAVKLQVSASGSYYNASTGIFVDFAGAGALKPVLTITAQSTNKVYGASLPLLACSYSGFIDGDTPWSLDAAPVLTTDAIPASPAGDYLIHISGAASSKYDLTYVDGTLSVLPARTSTSMVSSGNPALPGETVTFTATLAPVAPGSGTPTGSVQFRFDGASAGSLIAVNSGVASLTTSNLTHGAHQVAVEYAGDSNFLGSTNHLANAQIINTPPVLSAYHLERSADAGVKFSVASLLANFTDVDGDALTLLSTDGTSLHGGTVVSSNGWLFYDPPLGFRDADQFGFSISDGYTPLTGIVDISVRIDLGPSPNLVITNLANGSVLVRGDGIPGRTYRLEYATDTRNPEWQQLGTATADSFGSFTYIDLSGFSQRYYRSVFP